jgi:hypothetical protein
VAATDPAGDFASGAAFLAFRALRPRPRRRDGRSARHVAEVAGERHLHPGGWRAADGALAVLGHFDTTAPALGRWLALWAAAEPIGGPGLSPSEVVAAGPGVPEFARAWERLARLGETPPENRADAGETETEWGAAGARHRGTPAEPLAYYVLAHLCLWAERPERAPEVARQALASSTADSPSRPELDRVLAVAERTVSLKHRVFAVQRSGGDFRLFAWWGGRVGLWKL